MFPTYIFLLLISHIGVFGDNSMIQRNCSYIFFKKTNIVKIYHG